MSDHFLQGFRLECGREACLWREAARRSELEAGTGLHQELSEPGEPWEAKAFPRHRVHRMLRQRDYYEFEYNLGDIGSSGAPAWVLWQQPVSKKQKPKKPRVIVKVFLQRTIQGQ